MAGMRLGLKFTVLFISQPNSAIDEAIRGCARTEDEFLFRCVFDEVCPACMNVVENVAFG
jgi:hypothetical protein